MVSIVVLFAVFFDGSVMASFRVVFVPPSAEPVFLVVVILVLFFKDAVVIAGIFISVFTVLVRNLILILRLVPVVIPGRTGAVRVKFRLFI